MGITLEQIEALAPDQASLSAAKKLLKGSSWPKLAEGEGLVWGECQGSGSTPYRVVIHEGDGGYKCTCPSRKFPCKHSLALMWIRVEKLAGFVGEAPPEWVKDWMARRRGPTEKAAGEKPRASIEAAVAIEEEAPADPKAAERAAAARKRNREEREAAVLAGLEELDRWLEDQCELGMASFLARMTQACRTIAQRLVDQKAAGLAGRIDGMPARVFALPETARVAAVVEELAQLHLISQSYRRAGELPEMLVADARQAVGWSVTREGLLEDPRAERVSGWWRVVAVVSEVQADKLRRIETWLWREGEQEGRRWAVLVDFVPVSTGAAQGGYVAGYRFEAELCYYPSVAPLRAQIAELRQAAEPARGVIAMPKMGLEASFAAYEEDMMRLPWLGTMPMHFTDVRVRRNGQGLFVEDEGGLVAPLVGRQAVSAMPLVGVERLNGMGLWDGHRMTLLWAETPLGRWMC